MKTPNERKHALRNLEDAAPFFLVTCVTNIIVKALQRLQWTHADILKTVATTQAYMFNN
jgi:hypothetical protein